MTEMNNAGAFRVDAEDTHEVPLRVFGNANHVVGAIDCGAFGGGHMFGVGELVGNSSWIMS